VSNSFPNSLLKFQHQRIPAPIEFAVSLKVYVDKMSGDCPLCGHRDHDKSFEDEKETEE
jgi:hypothetical protein